MIRNTLSRFPSEVLHRNGLDPTRNAPAADYTMPCTHQTRRRALLPHITRECNPGWMQSFSMDSRSPTLRCYSRIRQELQSDSKTCNWMRLRQLRTMVIGQHILSSSSYSKAAWCGRTTSLQLPIDPCSWIDHLQNGFFHLTLRYNLVKVLQPRCRSHVMNCDIQSRNARWVIFWRCICNDFNKFDRKIEFRLCYALTVQCLCKSL